MLLPQLCGRLHISLMVIGGSRSDGSEESYKHEHLWWCEMRLVRLNVVAFGHLAPLIMSKETEAALASVKQTFLQWHCLNMSSGFCVIAERGNKERQASRAVALSSSLSLLAPHLTLLPERLPELVWWCSCAVKCLPRKESAKWRVLWLRFFFCLHWGFCSPLTCHSELYLFRNFMFWDFKQNLRRNRS